MYVCAHVYVCVRACEYMCACAVRVCVCVYVRAYMCACVWVKHVRGSVRERERVQYYLLLMLM